jgi:micrococcal nuclease
LTQKTERLLLAAIAGVVLILCCCLGGVLIIQANPSSSVTNDPTPDIETLVAATYNALNPTKSPTETLNPTYTPTKANIQNTTSPDMPACVSPNKISQEAIVTKVIDGDTVDVSIDGEPFTVRYIGIDTPETKHPEKPVEAYGPEATEKNKELVEGKKVVLVKDVSEVDQYGRLLRYVFVESLGGVFVNYELVRQGYASVSTYPPDVACADTFKQAEQMARQEQVGLWNPSMATEEVATDTPPTQTQAEQPIPSEDVIISYIFYDGLVKRVESDEYAEIKNNGSSIANLAGWKLNAGNPGQNFIFPSFSLQPGQSCKVYTNETHGDSCGGGSFGSGQAIWNNSGDCGYLYNASGEQVSEYCY